MCWYKPNQSPAQVACQRLRIWVNVICCFWCWCFFPIFLPVQHFGWILSGMFYICLQPPEWSHHNRNMSFVLMYLGLSSDTQIFHSPDKQLEFVTCGCYVTVPSVICSPTPDTYGWISRTSAFTAPARAPQCAHLTGISLSRADALAPGSNYIKSASRSSLWFFLDSLQ